MDRSVIITILILLIVISLFILVALNKRRVTSRKKDQLLSKLDSMKESVSSMDQATRRDAIIKLDNILSKALQYRYSNDSSCGDNLKNAKKLFRRDSYQDIWDVHKIRNDIVHDDREITEEEANHAYDVYKMSIHKILK